VHNRDSVTLTLKKEGEGAVLASDIDLPHDVELINPDHVIAHLTAGGKLDMQIKVKKAVAMCLVTCVVCLKTPTKPSAASFWMRRSRQCVAFPTPLNRPVWNSVPTWTS
jgi:hypothetical protein